MMARRPYKRLPNTLRGLWRVALEDLEKVERDARYRIDMGVWHVPPGPRTRVCTVCAAGAVIACRLDGGRDEDLVPSDFSPATYRKLFAIDYLRHGSIKAAWRALHRASFLDMAPERVFDEWDAPSYGDPDWWTWAEGLLGVLEAERL